MTNIKFQKHYVTNGAAKARVHYSAFQIVDTGEQCVTLYAKSYTDGDLLSEIFSDGYENDTDTMTDYFDKGRVRILGGHPLYEQAIARCKR